MNLLAIDLGGSHATCALLRDGAVRSSVRLDAAGFTGLRPLLPALRRTLEEIVATSGLALRDLQGIGFAFPGLVDSERHCVLSTNEKFRDAPSVDLRAWASEQLGVTLRLENDARAALLGERHAGAARGSDDVVMMTLGTGIGGSAMIGGALLRGRHHQAGVLGGHLPVRLAGRRCTCGNLGCAEAEASTWALPLQCADWPGFSESALADLAGPLNYAAVFAAAESGDRVATEVRDRSLAVWAAAAVGLVHAYDPDTLVLGGGVMGSAPAVLPYIERYVGRHAWTPWGRVRVRASELGDNAALVGLSILFQ
jgi:glucokinase